MGTSMGKVLSPRSSPYALLIITAIDHMQGTSQPYKTSATRGLLGYAFWWKNGRFAVTNTEVRNSLDLLL